MDCLGFQWREHANIKGAQMKEVMWTLFAGQSANVPEAAPAGFFRVSDLVRKAVRLWSLLMCRAVLWRPSTASVESYVGGS